MKRITLLMLCALCVNIIFAQNVRTKPVAKKPTATKVTPKAGSKTTKKPVAKKKTYTKKKTYGNYYYDIAEVDTAYAPYDDMYADTTAVAEPQLSESAMTLATYLIYPLGTVDLSLLDDNNTYNSFVRAIGQQYILNETNSDEDEIWVYASENATLANNTYCGLPLYNFYIDKKSNGTGIADYQYAFEIRKENMRMSVYDYCDQIVSDFQELGIPMTYKRVNDQYKKAEGHYKDESLEIDFEVNDYSLYNFQIKVYVY